MSNVFQNTSSGLAELKNYYQGPIVDTFNEDVAIYRAAEKGKESWSGSQVVRPLRVRRNQGIGATTDGGNLPSIGRQTTVQAQIAAKYNYLRFGISGPMIKASQSDKGSFVRSAQYEIEMGYKDLMSDVNRQLSWDGTGYLAKLSAAATSSTTVTVQGREGTTEDGSKFLDVGLVIDIVSSAGVVKASGVTINSLSGTTTATLGLSAPVTASSGDFVIRSGTQNAEVQGLLYALDAGTTTIYNVDRSLYPSYQGNVDDNAAAQLTLDTMQATYNKGLRRGGAKGYQACWVDYDSLRMYQKLLASDKRYSNTVKGDGGFANKDQFYLEFNGTPLVPDKDCPRRIIWIPEGVLKKYVLSEMEFADESGTMYIAQTGTDQYEVRVRLFFNLFNEHPASCAVLKNYISP